MKRIRDIGTGTKKLNYEKSTPLTFCKICVRMSYLVCDMSQCSVVHNERIEDLLLVKYSIFIRIGHSNERPFILPPLRAFLKRQLVKSQAEWFGVNKSLVS